MSGQRTRAAICVIVICAIATACSAAEHLDPCFRRLPPGCRVDRTLTVTGAQTAAISSRLGGAIKRISNTWLTMQGASLQVNILDARTEPDAVKIHKTLSAMKANPAFCLRKGARIIEFVGDDPSVAIKTSYELGFVPRPKAIRYRVVADVATVEKADYMASNKLLNLLVSSAHGGPDSGTTPEIAALSKGFRFGNKVRLRAPRQGTLSAAYSFMPSFEKKEHSPKHEATTYSFSVPMRTSNIPYVTLTADITADNTGMTPTGRTSDKALLAATEFWPVDDAEVAALARQITLMKETPQAKVQTILGWLAPGKNIEFGGPVTGSRWGVKQVLKQRYGHCWDFSDCFVTLCRACGVPCRQVAGWLYGASGHVWAEILIDGKNWQQVDPTGAGKLECGVYYIPYFVTEDGDMPILYVSLPKIEIVETK